MSFLATPSAATSANRRMVQQAPVASNILGTPWPTLWGQRDLNGTVIAWTNHRFSGSGASGKGGGQVSGGEKDYRTFALGLCIGPVDRITQVMYDNQIIWQGNVSIASAATTANSTIGVGGVVLTTSDNRGTIALYFGQADQTQDPILAQFIPDAPFYRGMCYAVFHGDRSGTKGFRIGNADTLAQIALRITRTPPVPAGTPFTSGISAGPNNSRLQNSGTSISVSTSGFTGVREVSYNVLANTFGLTDHTKANLLFAAADGSDTSGQLLITSGVPFAVGSFGLMVTISWSTSSGPLVDSSEGGELTWSIQLTSAMSVGGGANISNILYELLTSDVHGIALDTGLLDIAAFLNVTTLAGNAGLSYAVTTKDQARQLIDELLKNFQGALTISNGLLAPRFLAGGGDPVLTLEADDIIGLKQRPGAWYELPHHVIVKYADVIRNFRDTILSLPGAGDFGDDEKNIEIQLPMVTDQSIARLVGTRLRTLETLPKTPDTIICSRTAFPLQFGDTIVINDPPRGFQPGDSLIIVAVREHGVGDERIELDVAPDIFGLLPSTHVGLGGGGGGAIKSSEPITPIATQDVFELPWDFAPDGSKRFTIFAARPQPDVQGFSLYASSEQPPVDYDEVLGDATYHAGGVIKSISLPRFTMDREAYIDFDAASDDVDSFSSLSDSDWFAFKMLVLLGSGDSAALYAAAELLFLGDSRWRIQGIFGPLSDTLAAGGDIGPDIWIFRLQPLYNVLAEPAWVNGSVVTFKGIPFGSRLSPTLADATAATATVESRAARPFPAENLVANSRGSSLLPTYSGDIALNWSLRNRGFGFGYETNPSEFDTTIQSEIDSCDVEIWVGGTLKRTQSVDVRHGTFSTTIATGTIDHQTFPISDPTGLQPGDTISIMRGGGEWFGRIASISGSTTTLVSPLSIMPQSSDVVTRYESVGYVYDASTNAADNGSLASSVDVKVYPKLNGLRAIRAEELTVTKQ